ncbi:MAG: YesN/AraC family two-component response regulator [Gammaproteobacteria bacterium]|jgi:YesN/AraC family two-component response regulator
MTDRSVLFVDDEDGVLRAIKRIFRRMPVRVLTASNGVAALELLESESVQVVFSDQRMSQMDGTELLKVVRHKYPHTVRCILSGYAEMHAVMAAINAGNVYRFVAKPWDDRELVAVYEECAMYYEIAEQEREKNAAIASRADVLAREGALAAEQLRLQGAVLESSREVLEGLPVAVAAIDIRGRIIYTNRLFAGAFGYLCGAAPGASCPEPWSAVAAAALMDPGHCRSVRLQFAGTDYPVSVGRVEIAGEAHAILTLSIDGKAPHGSMS